MHRHQQLLQRCRVIANIRPFEKLSTTTDRLSTYPPSIISTVQRYWCREGRDQNLRVVEHLAMELLTSIEHTLGDVQSRENQRDEGEPTTDVKAHVQRNENNVFISEGVAVLKDMDGGLAHLKKTYAGDAAVEQRILTLQRTIQGRLQSIEELARLFKIPVLAQQTQDLDT
tara:strand:- start:427 stop:939 length:513 start_codon:yes stop_codon:yes gene_type:complete